MLLDYQAARGIPVTGVLDNATWAKLVANMPVPPFDQVVAAPDATGDGYADVVVVDAAGRLQSSRRGGRQARAGARVRNRVG